MYPPLIYLHKNLPPTINKNHPYPRHRKKKSSNQEDNSQLHPPRIGKINRNSPRIYP